MSTEQILAALLGPWGLVVAALIAVYVLWKQHVAADDKRDVALDKAQTGWASQTDATNDLVSVVSSLERAIEDRDTVSTALAVKRESDRSSKGSR